MKKSELFVITGMSGAGKTSALRILEDFGVFCVDNVPPSVISDFVSVLIESKINRLAIVIDVRVILKFGSSEEIISRIKKLGKELSVKIIFLDADDDIIMYRYRKTRRAHPLSKDYSLKEAIEKERQLMAPLMKEADFVLNTSYLEIQDFKNHILKLIQPSKSDIPPIRLIIESFSFGYGIPTDANLVFDVRFLANPFYLPKLAELSGKDPRIKDFLEKSKVLNKYMKSIISVIKTTLSEFSSTGRNQLKVAIGCTGGKHRSVYVAEKIYTELGDTFGDNVDIILHHREL
ncbi:MAG: RNase adapter RapZ [Kosmotoga sp.]|nr:MAG: RNase adapter RapZ [Kosmotoga sp.]